MTSARRRELWTPRAGARRSGRPAKRVVVKIGSRLLAESPASRPAAIADQVVELRRRGVEVVIVSSGAIALGVRRLRLPGRPHRAAGAAGGRRRRPEPADAALGARVRRRTTSRSARCSSPTTTSAIAAASCPRGSRCARCSITASVPIINENDTVATEEIKFGDNDQLAALACNLVAPPTRSIILTDVEGRPRRRPACACRSSRATSTARPRRSPAQLQRTSAPAAWRCPRSARRAIVTRTGVPAVVAPGPRAATRPVRVLAGAWTRGTLSRPRQARRCRRAAYWIAYGAAASPGGQHAGDRRRAPQGSRPECKSPCSRESPEVQGS